MALRQYESATVFTARAVDIRYLWTPSGEYKGKKQDKPSWYGSFITPKTTANWMHEPAFGPLCAAFGKLYVSHPAINNWPIVDGDMPHAETGKQSDWARGHWLFSGNSSNGAPNVEVVQHGGSLVKLTGPVGVKAGDHCIVGLSAAVAQNDARRCKLFLNACVFTQSGPEIAFVGSVTGNDLMAQAAAQGIHVAGIQPAMVGAAGGFAGGFQPPQQQNPFGQPQGQQPANGFQPQGNPFGQPPGHGYASGGFAGGSQPPPQQQNPFGQQGGFQPPSPSPFGAQQQQPGFGQPSQPPGHGYAPAQPGFAPANGQGGFAPTQGNGIPF